MLAFLVRNWRQAGEFGILAPTVEVANNAYKPAADAIKADPELSALFQVQDHIRTITHRETKATMQVVAADSDTVAGKKWIVTLIDELWLFGKKHGAEDMLREATGGLASRDEGCVLWLSTQSNDPPAGVFKQKLQYARKVRDGEIIDPQFCPVIYEFPQKMIDTGQHLKPENFYITNPNLGASVNEAYLVRELSKAQEAGQESLCGFMAKHLNIEIGLALRSDRWAGADHWLKRAEPGLTLESLLARSDVVQVGIDGGGLDDMLGLAVLGRDANTGQWLLWARAWIHEIVLERRKSEAQRFRDFEAQGDLVIVPDDSEQDIFDVAEAVRQVVESGLLDKVGVDPVGIGAIVDALVDESCGVQADQIVGVSQGYRLMGAIKTTERKLASNGMVHCGAPLMAWCVGNCKAEPKGNAILITKQASGFAKIDPVMASFNAVSIMSLAPAQNIIGEGAELLVA